MSGEHAPPVQEEPLGAGSGGTGRRGGRRRVLVWTAAVVAGVLVLAGVGVGVVYARLNGNIHSSDIRGRLGGDRPSDTAGKDLNILVLGSDTRQGSGGEYGPRLGSQQSDTMLLVHIPANRRWAAVVSVPRDSWVKIPSCSEGDGTTSSPTHFKINHAFAEGALHGGTVGGAVCAIKTFEANAHVKVDHFVVVDFNGFKAMTKAIGGVPVCVTQPVDDPKSHLQLPAGNSVVEGDQALAFVRARYTIGDGSDLGRIDRQQQFMASMARQAKSKLLDPPALYGFLDAATKSLTTDSGLGSLKALYDVASSVKGLPTGALEFLTVPTVPRSTVVPSDKANVIWKEPEASRLFADLARDVNPVTGTDQPPAAGASPAPSPSTSGSPAPSTSGSSASPTPSGTLTPSVTGDQASCAKT